MNTTLQSLSDEALLSSAHALLGKSNAVEADLIEHLGEIDDRKLYLGRSHPSLFAFCVDGLGMSEDVACNRIAVARAARRLPSILEALRSGKVHLAGLRLLVPHLTGENCDLVLLEAAGKSKRLIEEFVAQIAPSPPVRTSIRRMPENPVAAWSPIPKQSLLGPSIVAAQTAAGAAAAAARRSVAEAASAAAAAATSATPEALRTESLQPESTASRQRDRRTVVAPLSGETFKVQFTATRSLRDKLVEAQGLLRHRVPDGDVPAIIEKALDLLIERVKKERFATTSKGRRHAGKKGEAPPRPRVAQAAPTDSNECDDASNLPQSAALSRHIPAEIRRAVYERDGGCCTYVDDQGSRCGSKDGVTFDHRDGFARTRVHSIESLRLRCRAHNQYEAEKMYGRDFMDRARGATASPPAGPAPIRPGADPVSRSNSPGSDSRPAPDSGPGSDRQPGSE